MFKTYKDTLNLIKLGNKKKLSRIKIPFNSMSITILSFFFKEGLIKGYRLYLDENKIEIFFKSIRRQPLIEDINIFYKNKYSRLNLTYSKIRYYYGHKDYYYVLLTSGGLFSMDSCLTLKKGGILGFRVKF